MNEHVQQVIIGIIVSIALISVVRRMMPKWSRARQQAIAQWLDREGRGKVMRVLGQRLMPAQSGGGGCGSGCNTCSSCETPTTPDQSQQASAQSTVKPLEFRRNP